MLKALMKENVGGWDRNMRLILGTTALVAGLVAPIRRSWKIALLTFAATELFTGNSRYCPVNEALGVNTSRRTLTRVFKGVVESLAA
jgi:hypothetical protein